MDIIGRPFLRIVSNISKGVKGVRSLAISRGTHIGYESYYQALAVLRMGY
jgi:hypothetical protein